jgi:phosphodiester glycosidase/carboxypeptidase family protein
MGLPRRAVALLAPLLALSVCGVDEEVVAEQTLVNPPANAVFVPADYDGDGLTDFGYKTSSGIWYIDVARCWPPDRPETACDNYIDDDLDGFINDGCPAIGDAVDAAEVTIVNACRAPYHTAFDDDNDGYLDDGCPTNHQCLGSEGYGNRWDFVYYGYGDGSAIPVPADYGMTYGGPADGKADLAIKAADGTWAIDFADNGFGTFDEIRGGYGFADVVPWPADYDGDGRADLSVRSTDGAWFFDYSSDGFNGWNIPCAGGCPCVVHRGVGFPVLGYGGRDDTPAVGDVDGDSCADLSVKTTVGTWFFDLAADGFRGWQAPCPSCAVPLAGYGDASNKPIIANFDPGYDKLADLAVQMSDGHWAIDFAADGFGTWNTFPFYFAGWAGGGATFVPGRFSYTPGNLDLAVKGTNGFWYVDRAYNGYGNIDFQGHTSPTLFDETLPYIDTMWISQPTVPGAPTSGNFSEAFVSPAQLKVGVRYTANIHLVPGMECVFSDDTDLDGVPNDGCPPVGAPETACTDWVDDDGDGRLNDGCPAFPPEDPISEVTPASVNVNPDLHVSPSLNVENVGGHIVQNSAPGVVYTHTRRLGFTCHQPGVYRLGFMLSRAGTSTGLNVDYGTNVACTADFAGIYGVVNNKRTGKPIAGASVVAGGVSRTTDANGFWNVDGLTGGPHRVVIMKSGFAPLEAVNVRVPGFGAPAGIQVDAALEESFILQQGITYKTYLDYSRGRTILHSVRIDVTRAPITIGKVPFAANGEFQRLVDVAVAQHAPVMINGIWWTLDTENFLKDIGQASCSAQAGPPVAATRSIGYLYINGFVPPGECAGGICRPSEVECASAEYFANPVPGRAPAPAVAIQDAWTTPLFGVKGTGSQRRANIVMTDTDFMASTNGWKRVAGVPNCPAGNACPIYDAARPYNRSDYLYAFQMGHVLLRAGTAIARGVINHGGFAGEFAYARTSIGTNFNGTVAWFVIADGEGIDGGNGATPNQLGEFYRDILQATDAMIVDSGESTELVLRGATGPRRVNRLSSENNGADGVAPEGDFTPGGQVFSYIKAGS